MQLSGRIVLTDRVIDGTISFGAVITGIEPGDAAGESVILPGFIDTHVHGGEGGDTMDGVAGIAAAARYHLRHGTTTLLPTTMTAPWPDVLDALRAVGEVRGSGLYGGPDLPGAHLEGPFISPHRLGAQPPFAIEPEPALVREALALDVVRVVTIAPELAGAAAAMRLFARAGVRVSAGHTRCGCEQALHAFASVRAAGGTAGATHLFNAMGGIEGRAPGLAGAVLHDGHAYAELILDTHHVHPMNFAIARDILGDRLLLITDAMRAAGQGEGPSELGGQPVTVRDGIARLDGGALAGSVLTMDAALRNACAASTGLAQASRLVSGNAAAYLGLQDRGALRPGLRADIVVLDAALRVQEVWVAGRRVA
ncbi:N-acetylglucosamine-6-phosphate deacetylase [Lichenicoccus sp.]|uniref:N-acetylglucosamine-6-phosphate deacetylase n=1 Tax=Lichenicoccus sp. TaxID=2781899 RepID=UPI003D0B072D